MSFPSASNNWTLFLDRDGVINRRVHDGYITTIENFVFLPYVFEGLNRLAKQFSKIIIVTNQQGVGKGIMSHSDLDNIHKYMLEEFKKEGIIIDSVYCATNLRNAENDRRKPNTRMGLDAKNDFPNLDFHKAIMVGDTDSDIQFGKNLGMKTVLVRSKEDTKLKPDYTVNNLNELADAFNL